MKVLLNSFSLNFFPNIDVLNITIKKLSENDMKNNVLNNTFISFLGHQDLCNILNTKFDTDQFVFNRSSFQWTKAVSSVIIAQYKGERLPEGTTALPPNSSIEYYEVTV